MADSASPPPQSNAAFVADVRAFLDRALTPDLRAAGRATLGVHSDIDAARAWHRILHAQGWIAPAWPKAHGGCGWTIEQRFLFERECALNDAPVLFAGGLRSLGPLLIEQGTQEQKKRFLPAMLSGDDLWCQGFSEPGAGSDLAALQTRAERVGDRYVINGQKIWTTGAHLANRMFALARTGADKRGGITFLLIDMNAPGISVRPIESFSGEHECNEVFFDGVEAPIENRVGDENDGWRMAQRLMRLARSNNTTSGTLRRTLRRAAALVRESGDASAHLRLSLLETELAAFEALEMRMIPLLSSERGGDLAPSTLKLRATELHQEIAALAMDAAAPHIADKHDWASGKYFALRAATIYSGSSEVHRNVLARALLA